MSETAHGNSATRRTMPVSVVMPVLLGLSAFIGLYKLLENGAIGDELVYRYLAGHPVSKVTTAMFLVGLASLGLIALDVIRQRRSMRMLRLDRAGDEPAAEGNEAPDSATEASPTALQTMLSACSSRHQATWLWRRVFTACQYVERNGHSEGLDDELKYACEVDGEERQDRYSFVRIMIWAIPMLGFLGTVLGISEALGGLDLGGESDFPAMMGALRSSLYVAFDTTAQALTFAIVLMFGQFAIDRVENDLMGRVESRSREILASYWEISSRARDSWTQAVEAMGSRVLASSEELVQRQARIWRKSMEAAEASWVESVQATRQTVQQSLQQALQQSTSALGSQLQSAIEQSDEAAGRRWDQWQLALSENARLLQGHQKQLVDQTVIIEKVMQRLGDLAQTRQELAQLLSSQASAPGFREAATSLATAIRLLEFRIKETVDPVSFQKTVSLAEAKKRLAA